MGIVSLSRFRLVKSPAKPMPLPTATPQDALAQAAELTNYESMTQWRKIEGFERSRTRETGIDWTELHLIRYLSLDQAGPRQLTRRRCLINSGQGPRVEAGAQAPALFEPNNSERRLSIVNHQWPDQARVSSRCPMRIAVLR